MRATPLSVYCHRITDARLIAYLTKLDVSLTHSHPTAIQCVTYYNIAISYLLRNPGDFEGAIATLDECLQELGAEKDLAEAWKTIKSATDESELIPANKNIGYVVIAFSYAFFYLKQNLEFTEALKRTLKLGGDTDTNAAIVCGLLGARWGIDAIPKEYQTAILDSDHIRPDWLKPCGEQFFKKIDELVRIGPDNDNLKAAIERNIDNS